MSNRIATNTLFGFDFQVNAAIVIMLENIVDVDAIRMEGKEDIEILLNDGRYILAQAKSVVRGSHDFTNVTTNLTKAMESLAEASRGLIIKELIYITNSANPFNIKSEKHIFEGRPTHRSYNDLLPQSQKKIDGVISNLTVPIDKSRLLIQTLPFETDDKRERYKYVWSVIEELLNKIGNVSISKEYLHKTWCNDIFHSGTIDNQKIKLTKTDIIWPIIVMSTNQENYDNYDLDEAEVEEVAHLYSNIINTYTERYEFLTKVLHAFNDFIKDKEIKDRIRIFVSEKYVDFLYIMDETNIDDHLKEIIIKIILTNILTKRFLIKRIKERVNL
jgi:hypothetical protein